MVPRTDVTRSPFPANGSLQTAALKEKRENYSVGTKTGSPLRANRRAPKPC